MPVTQALLDWYQQHARDLPWRHTQDAYHIWISEIMLQQTQVKTVLPRYNVWFEVFPSIQSLAEAELGDVLKQWEGLGYYRRARFIHAAALDIMQHHDGQFPANFDDMLKLKGIARSTAGAISSFCFKTHTPVLDGNVKRVLSAWDNQIHTDKALWLIAEKWIQQTNSPDMWNQAMMELGATHCQAKKRTCSLCPINQSCKSAFTEPLKKNASVKVKDVFWQINVHQNEAFDIWLEQRPEQGIWAGLWTPPITILDTKPDAAPSLIHQLTHRRLHLYLNTNSSKPTGEGRWVNSWEGFAIPTGIHRLFESKLSNHVK